MRVVSLPRVSLLPLRGIHCTLGFGYFSLSGWGCACLGGAQARCCRCFSRHGSHCGYPSPSSRRWLHHLAIEAGLPIGEVLGFRNRAPRSSKTWATCPEYDVGVSSSATEGGRYGLSRAARGLEWLWNPAMMWGSNRPVRAHSQLRGRIHEGRHPSKVPRRLLGDMRLW